MRHGRIVIEETATSTTMHFVSPITRSIESRQLMENGDISNVIPPAILIDASGILFQPRRPLWGWVNRVLSWIIETTQSYRLFAWFVEPTDNCRMLNTQAAKITGVVRVCVFYRDTLGRRWCERHMQPACSMGVRLREVAWQHEYTSLFDELDPLYVFTIDQTIPVVRPNTGENRCKRSTDLRTLFAS